MEVEFVNEKGERIQVEGVTELPNQNINTADGSSATAGSSADGSSTTAGDSADGSSTTARGSADGSSTDNHCRWFCIWELNHCR